MFKSNFNGDRLKLARRFNKLTLTEMAEYLNVSKQMISKYEKNQSQPSSESLFQLEQLLGFPRRFYFEDNIKESKVGNTYFRALSKATKKDLEAQKIRIDLLSVIYKFIDDYIELPALNYPEFDLTYSSIEEMAVQARSFWKLGEAPIENMVKLLEANGFIVSTSKFNIDVIDAYTQVREINGKECFIIVLGSDKGNYFRRQFDAAHELAHVLIHDAYLDLSTLSKEEEKEIEAEANNFASAFLLPRDPFIKDISIMPTDLNHYVYLKKKWHVSVGAMVRRAFNLGVISSSEYDKLQRTITRWGWRREEPLDRETRPTSPVLLSKSIITLLDEKIFNGTSLMDELTYEYKISITSSMLEDLVGLENGTVEKYRPTNVIPNVVLELKNNKED